MDRRSLLAVVVAAMLAAGCAAPGAPFASLESVPSDKGHLYLYRKSAIYASAAKFKVRDSSGALVGELYNASYLLLPLAPGKHQFSVDEGGFASPKSFEVNVEAGRNHYVEYDSSKGLLLGWGMLSGNQQRTETQALADLKGLNRAN